MTSSNLQTGYPYDGILTSTWPKPLKIPYSVLLSQKPQNRQIFK